MATAGRVSSRFATAADGGSTRKQLMTSQLEAHRTDAAMMAGQRAEFAAAFAAQDALLASSTVRRRLSYRNTPPSPPAPPALLRMFNGPHVTRCACASRREWLGSRQH